MVILSKCMDETLAGVLMQIKYIVYVAEHVYG